MNLFLISLKTGVNVDFYQKIYDCILLGQDDIFN